MLVNETKGDGILWGGPCISTSFSLLLLLLWIKLWELSLALSDSMTCVITWDHFRSPEITWDHHCNQDPFINQPNDFIRNDTKWVFVSLTARHLLTPKKTQSSHQKQLNGVSSLFHFWKCKDEEYFFGPPIWAIDLNSGWTIWMNSQNERSSRRVDIPCPHPTPGRFRRWFVCVCVFFFFGVLPSKTNIAAWNLRFSNQRYICKNVDVPLLTLAYEKGRVVCYVRWSYRSTLLPHLSNSDMLPRFLRISHHRWNPYAICGRHGLCYATSVRRCWVYEGSQPSWVVVDFSQIKTPVKGMNTWEYAQNALKHLPVNQQPMMNSGFGA